MTITSLYKAALDLHILLLIDETQDKASFVNGVHKSYSLLNLMDLIKSEIVPASLFKKLVAMVPSVNEILRHVCKGRK